MQRNSLPLPLPLALPLALETPLALVYAHIKNTINEQSRGNNPIVIYTGVGVAAHGAALVEPQHYHQYPPFLQKIKNEVRDSIIFLVLIDPFLEPVPVVVRDFNLVLDSPFVEVYVDEAHVDEAHVDEAHSLYVYCVRQWVYTDVDTPVTQDGAQNITATLRDLNAFAQAQQITTLYHDFSGRRNNLLAELFDAELAPHLDTIIYGFMLRADLGCYVDLLSELACFPYLLVGRDLRKQVQFLNIYKFVETNTMAHRNKAVLETQQKNVVQQWRTEFIRQSLAIFRLILRLRQGPAEQGPAEQGQGPAEQEQGPAQQGPAQHVDVFFQHLPYATQERCKNLIQNQMYDELYDLMFTYFSQHLERYTRLNEMDLSGRELLTFILKGTKPYDWTNNFLEFS